MTVAQTSGAWADRIESTAVRLVVHAFNTVMPVLDTGIHGLEHAGACGTYAGICEQGCVRDAVDGRVKPGHDGCGRALQFGW